MCVTNKITPADKKEVLINLEYYFVLSTLKGYCKTAAEFVAPYLMYRNREASGKQSFKEGRPAYERERRLRLKERGLCYRCGKRPISKDRSESMCSQCLDRASYTQKKRQGDV
jgi:hypothetical protein